MSEQEIPHLSPSAPPAKRRGRGTRVGVVAFVLAAAAGAVALSGGGGSDPDIEVSTASLAAAAEATMSQSSRFEFWMEMDGMFMMSEPIAFGGTGVMIDDTMEMAMDMGAMLDQVAAQTGEPVPPDEAALFAEPMRLIQDGAVMYMCHPSFAIMASEFGAEAAECMRLRFDDATAALMEAQMADQDSALAPLFGVPKPESVGLEDVRGVRTQHIRGSVTMREATEAAPPDLRDAMIEAHAENFGTGADAEALLDLEMPIEVWIDDEGLVRRVRQEMPGEFFAAAADDDQPGLRALADATATMTMEFYDFDVDLEIEIPDTFFDYEDLPVPN